MPPTPDTPPEPPPPLLHARRRPFPWWIVVSVLVGLPTAEAAAALHVYLSNRDLHRTMTAISDAGYLAVPNDHIIPTLLSFKTALYGGIFYTLSVGAALVVLSLVMAWAWDRFFHRDRRTLVSPILLWAACIIGANHQGFAPLATIHFLVIPPVVFGLAVFLMPSRHPADRRNREWLIHPVALILLAALGASQMEAEVFSRFRNRCLLDNSVGLAVTDFYYRYTLYAAQTFKSLDQRLLNACHVETGSPSLTRRIESRLARYDYLAIGDRHAANLRIDARQDVFHLKSGDGPILRIPQSQFFGDTRKHLKDFSQQTDRHGFLRGFTFVCLIGQSLVILYVFFSIPVQLALRPFLSPFRAKAAAAVVCGNIIASVAALPGALPVATAGVADAALILYLGVLQIGLAYLFLTSGMRGVPALEASLLLLLEPVLNPVWAWMVHGETPAPLALAGAGVILAATAVHTWREGRSGRG